MSDDDQNEAEIISQKTKRVVRAWHVWSCRMVRGGSGGSRYRAWGVDRRPLAQQDIMDAGVASGRGDVGLPECMVLVAAGGAR